MTSLSEQAAEIAEAIGPELFSRFTSEPRESLADRVAARKWATEYLSEQIESALRAVACETWEAAAKVCDEQIDAADTEARRAYTTEYAERCEHQKIQAGNLAAEFRTRKESV